MACNSGPAEGSLSADRSKSAPRPPPEKGDAICVFFAGIGWRTGDVLEVLGSTPESADPRFRVRYRCNGLELCDHLHQVPWRHAAGSAKHVPPSISRSKGGPAEQLATWSSGPSRPTRERGPPVAYEARPASGRLPRSMSSSSLTATPKRRSVSSDGSASAGTPSKRLRARAVPQGDPFDSPQPPSRRSGADAPIDLLNSSDDEHAANAGEEEPEVMEVDEIEVEVEVESALAGQCSTESAMDAETVVSTCVLPHPTDSSDAADASDASDQARQTLQALRRIRAACQTCVALLEQPRRSLRLR